MKTLSLTDDEFDIVRQALYDRADILRRNIELAQVSKEDAYALIDDALRLRGKLDEMISPGDGGHPATTAPTNS